MDVGTVNRSTKHMKVAYDRKRKPTINYEFGVLVLWKQAASNTGDKGLNNKLANKQVGLFKLAKAMEKIQYLIASIKEVKDYRGFKFVVALDTLRLYPELMSLKLVQQIRVNACKV